MKENGWKKDAYTSNYEQMIFSIKTKDSLENQTFAGYRECKRDRMKQRVTIFSKCMTEMVADGW